MRYLHMLAIMLLLPMVARAQNAPAAGKIYSEKGKAGATFPGKPSLDSSRGSDTYILGENQDRHGYVLGIAYFAPSGRVDITDAAQVKRALDTVERGLRNSLGTKPSQVKSEAWGPDKLPSRYYEFVLADGGVYWSRVVLTGQRTVSITVSGPADWARGAKAQAFLKSLKVDPDE